MEKIIVDISWDKNYGAVLEEVNGVVIATHKTLEGVKKAFESALLFHIDGLMKDGDDIPEILRADYQLIFRLDTHALLNHYKGIFTYKALSRVTGINEKLLGHYAQGLRNPRTRQRQKIVDGIQKLGRELTSVV